MEPSGEFIPTIQSILAEKLDFLGQGPSTATPESAGCKAGYPLEVSLEAKSSESHLLLSTIDLDVCFGEP